MNTKTKLWLDDVRPAPEGWTWCKNIEDAKALLLTGTVVEASLDHDLGMDAVINDLSPEGQRVLAKFGDVSTEALPAEDDGKLLLRAMELMRSKAHQENNGFALCCWMRDTGNWPTERIRVHSANPAGAARMAALIEIHFKPIKQS